MKAYLQLFILVFFFSFYCYKCQTNIAAEESSGFNAFSGKEKREVKYEKTEEKVVASVSSAPGKVAVKTKIHPKLKSNSNCNSSSFDAMTVVRKAVKKNSGLKYRSSDTTDCSGIFHRVLFELKAFCSDAKLPPFSARSSRNLARWYHDHGTFNIIRNAAQSGDLITEGAVVFYGHGRGKSYDFSTMKITDLTNGNSGINHVAIVTKVNRENGKLVSYELFHGRNKRKKSGITTAYLAHPRKAKLPAYGHYDAPLLAVAQLFGN
ncbi:MAG: hypothetical protein AB8F74_22520 [Saprospiraceae bacterium]